MNLKPLYIALGSLLALAAAYGAGRYSAPTLETTKTEWLTTTQQVRTVVFQRVVDTKIKRVVVVDTRPDGSSRSVTTEASETHEETLSAENENSYKNDKGAVESKTTREQEKWTIFVTAGVGGLTPLNLSAQPQFVWGVGVQRRILWNIWAGAYYQSNGSISGTLGLGF